MADPWIVTFLVIAFISIIGNGLSVIQLLRLGSLNAVTSKLILFLHFSGMIHSIGQMPLLYYQNEGLCDFMGFAHFYGGLVNAVALVFLSTAYVNFLLEKPENNLFIQNYGGYITFIFPLITLLPLTTNSYDATGVWCTLPVVNEISNVWSFAVSYVWVIMALFYATGVLIYVIYHSWHERSLTRTLLSAAGIYIIVTWIGLIPGLVPRLIAFATPINRSDATQFFIRAPSNLASIAYCLCFIANYSTFTEYEKHYSRSNQSAENEITFAELEKALNERGSRSTNDIESGGGSSLQRRPSNISVGSINDDLVSTSQGRRHSSTNNVVKDYLTQLRRQYSVEKRTNSVENASGSLTRAGLLRLGTSTHNKNDIDSGNGTPSSSAMGGRIEGLRISQISVHSSPVPSETENPILNNNNTGRLSNVRRTFGSSLADNENFGSGL